MEKVNEPILYGLNTRINLLTSYERQGEKVEGHSYYRSTISDGGLKIKQILISSENVFDIRQEKMNILAC
jgi:hypothetical protein